MYERSYGAKYDGDLTGVEIAKRVRADIKAATKAGLIPAGVYSVRYDSYSMGQSIDVTIMHLPGVAVIHPDRPTFDALTLDEQDRRVIPSIYSPVGAQILDNVKAILWAYNHDGSDSQVDYFDVKFHGDVRFDSDFTSAERARILAGEPADATEEYQPEKRKPAKPQPSTRDFMPDSTLIPLAPIEVYGKPYDVEKVANGPAPEPTYVLTSKRGAKIGLHSARDNPTAEEVAASGGKRRLAFWPANLDRRKKTCPLARVWLFEIDGVLMTELEADAVRDKQRQAIGN